MVNRNIFQFVTYCWYYIPTCIFTLLLVLYPLSPYYWYYTHLYIHPIIGIIPTCIFILLLVLYPLVYSPYYWYHTHLYIHPIIGIIPICIFTLLLVLYPLVYSPYYWYYTHLYIHPIIGIYPLVYSPYYWYYTHLYIHPIIGIIPTCIFTLLLVLYPLVYSLICNHSGNKYHTSCCNLFFIFIPIAIIIFVMPSGIVFPILTIM